MSHKDNIESNNELITIIGFNLDENRANINFILEKSPSIILLSEVLNDNTIKEFGDYHCIGSVKSHCMTVYLLIRRKIFKEVIDVIKIVGAILAVVDTTFGRFVIGSVHLYFGKEGESVRNKQVKHLYDYITVNQLESIPIIIGGDTNMRNEKNDLSRNFQDTALDLEMDNLITWPNKSLNKFRDFKGRGFRYDRIYTKNVFPLMYKRIKRNDSDHYAIEAQYIH